MTYTHTHCLERSIHHRQPHSSLRSGGDAETSCLCGWPLTFSMRGITTILCRGAAASTERLGRSGGNGMELLCVLLRSFISLYDRFVFTCGTFFCILSFLTFNLFFLFWLLVFSFPFPLVLASMNVLLNPFWGLNCFLLQFCIYGLNLAVILSIPSSARAAGF